MISSALLSAATRQSACVVCGDPRPQIPKMTSSLCEAIYANNPCLPFGDIAPRDGMVVEKCRECRDGYCYDLDDTANCNWCEKLVKEDGPDYQCTDLVEFCDDCGTLYKQFKKCMDSISGKRCTDLFGPCPVLGPRWLWSSRPSSRALSDEEMRWLETDTESEQELDHELQLLMVLTHKLDNMFNT